MIAIASLTRPEQLALPLVARASPEALFARVYRRLGFRGAMPEFRVEFCPFAGVRSTIRLRENLAEVRITDVLEDAPPLVLEALAEILLAQIYRRRPSREARECYLAYIFLPQVSHRIDEARRARGHKKFRPAQGHHYDLERIFEVLNRRFFEGRLAPPRLGWSPKRSRTLLGHYDAAHHTITISRRLDAPSVPRYLVEYLVYHEMLHICFPLERHGHRRVVHSRAFREAEKTFPHYDKACRKLKLICG